MPNIIKICHHFPTLIYSDKNGKINYYAADEDGVSSFDGELIINLTMEPGTRSVSTTYKIPELSSHMQSLPEEIVVGWGDFDIPPVKFSFWKALHGYLKKKHYHNVCFHCGYGHGRTGTALAAMQIANLGMDAESAILSIRDRYCSQAVESRDQIRYLLELDAQLNDLAPLDSSATEELIQHLYVPAKLFKNNFTWLRTDEEDPEISFGDEL